MTQQILDFLKILSDGQKELVESQRQLNYQMHTIEQGQEKIREQLEHFAQSISEIQAQSKENTTIAEVVESQLNRLGRAIDQTKEAMENLEEELLNAKGDIATIEMVTSNNWNYIAKQKLQEKEY